MKATVGVLESVLYLLREDGVTHLGAASDHIIESWRNARWPGYKTGFGVDPALKAQFSLAEEALRAMGVVVWPMVEWEADDALGTAAVRWADDPAVERVVVLTPDKDMAQLVREDGKVVQYDRRKREFMDADGVRAKFGVSPESIPDYLALVGDSADGYPGIPGWGKQSAATVLSRYRHLEDIPDSVARWDLSVRGAPSLAASLRDHRHEAELFRVLATLVTDVPLPETLDELSWRGASRAEFTAMAQRLGQPSLVSRVHRWAELGGASRKRSAAGSRLAHEVSRWMPSRSST